MLTLLSLLFNSEIIDNTACMNLDHGDEFINKDMFINAPHIDRPGSVDDRGNFLEPEISAIGSTHANEIDGFFLNHVDCILPYDLDDPFTGRGPRGVLGAKS